MDVVSFSDDESNPSDTLEEGMILYLKIEKIPRWDPG